MSEETLSDKIIDGVHFGEGGEYLDVPDVREFIRRLEKACKYNSRGILVLEYREIGKLAGPALTGGED